MGTINTDNIKESSDNERVIYLNQITSAKNSLRTIKEPIKQQDESPSQEITNLFERYSKALKLFVLVMVKCENTAEEIAQESYLRFLRIQDEKVIAHPRAYLFRTAQNLSTDFIRRNAKNIIDRKVEVNEENIAGKEASPEELTILLQTKDKLDNILEKMPHKARQVFYYRRYDGFSFKEISFRMNVSERMVFKYMHIAMQHLATGFKKEI